MLKSKLVVQWLALWPHTQVLLVLPVSLFSEYLVPQKMLFFIFIVVFMCGCSKVVTVFTDDLPRL